MVITAAQFGMTLEDRGETEADIEAGLRATFNLLPYRWGFRLSRGGMSQGSTPPIPLMTASFFLIQQITTQSVN